MTYLKRFLWLAAWSVWLWLGVGLFRELPREVGPVVCTLPLGAREVNHGFWGGCQRIVSEISHGEGKPVVLRVWDPETGRLIRQLDGPPAYWRGNDYTP